MEITVVFIEFMKAAVIAIGTEITDGEILNTNSQWLSEKLLSLNIRTHLQLAVADEKNEMLSAFKYASSICDIVLITGGLGPTSDDFTRNVVADWAGRELIFHSQRYSELESRYASMGRKLAPGHRNLCLFPEGSQILVNGTGTAHGFQLQVGVTSVYVLPGPPLEVISVWEMGLGEKLKSISPEASHYFYSWKCFGVGESEVASKVEPLLVDKNCTVGYRASVPFVHVKLWVPAQNGAEQSGLVREIESSLKPWLVLEDHYLKLKNKLEKFKSAVLVDESSPGLFASRAYGILLVLTSLPNFTNESILFECILRVRPVSAEKWKFEVIIGKQNFSKEVTVPYNLKTHQTYAHLYLLEQAPLIWLGLLNS